MDRCLQGLCWCAAPINLNCAGMRENHASCVLEMLNKGIFHSYLVIFGGFLCFDDECSVSERDIMYVELSVDDGRIVFGSVQVHGALPVDAPHEGSCICSLSILRHIDSVYGGKASVGSDLALLFGGLDDSGNASNSMWLFFLTASEVEMEKKQRMILAKGCDDNLQSSFRISVVAENIDAYIFGSNKPRARSRHAGVVYVESIFYKEEEEYWNISFRFFLFGGEDSEGVTLGDTWMLSGEVFISFLYIDRKVLFGSYPAIVKGGHLCWHQIYAGMRSIDSPPPRVLASLQLFNVKLESGENNYFILLYGGVDFELCASCSFPHNEHHSFSDVWILSLSDAPLSDIKQWNVLWRDGESPLPRANGHVAFQWNDDINNEVFFFFFGGKDFSEGNDNLHVLKCFLSSNGGGNFVDRSHFKLTNDDKIGIDYKCIECPFLQREYVRSLNNGENDPASQIGVGLWPHWRYCASTAVFNVSDKKIVLLIGGCCRHKDTNSLYYLIISKDQF